MPRKPREISDTGMYHVLLRCVRNDKFFRVEADYNKFLELLEINKSECGYSLYAYMLGENEVRLLIKVGEVSIENIFKRLCVKYTYWYNCKYQRNGSLFFDRFKSEPVEDDDTYDNTFRYIVKCPEYMGICKDFKEYKYSSINDKIIVDSYRTYDDAFFNVTTNGKPLVVKKQPLRITDEQAAEIILEVMEKNDIAEVLNMPSSEKYSKSDILLKKGIGYRQLSRLAGMNYVTVKNALSGKDTEKKSTVKKEKLNRQNTATRNRKQEEEIIDFFAL